MQTTNSLELSVTSYFITPRQLLHVRIGCLVFTLMITSWTLTVNPEVYFAMLTNWSWIGLCIYFCVTTGLSFAYHKNGHLKAWSSKQQGWSSWLFEVLFAVTQTISWMVVIVYWALLSTQLASMTNVNHKSMSIIEHSCDLILVLIEMFLTRTVVTLKTGLYPIMVALLYTFWTWIFVYTGIWTWPYGFFAQGLNPKEKPWWVTVLALLVGCLVVYIIFLIVYGTYRLREALGYKKLHKIAGEFTETMTPIKEDDVVDAPLSSIESR